MKQRFGLLPATLVLAATNPAAAREAPVAIPAAEANRLEADKLARLIYPEMLNRAITAYTIAHIVTPAYHADPGLRSLEKDYPGIIDAMIAAIRPVFAQGRVDALPALWTKTAAVYTSNLSREELQEAIAFYESLDGQRLAAAEREAIASAPPPTLSDQGDPGRLSETLADDVHLTRSFDATATERKLATLQPRIDAIIAAWNEVPAPATDARVSAALSKVVASFQTSVQPTARKW